MRRPHEYAADGVNWLRTRTRTMTRTDEYGNVLRSSYPYPYPYPYSQSHRAADPVTIHPRSAGSARSC